jgi:hypothetical protein
LRGRQDAFLLKRELSAERRPKNLGPFHREPVISRAIADRLS